MQAGMNKGAEYEHMNKLSELGLRATWLVLGHTEWVKRRVEGIQFRPGGDTRRRISFDVSIPPHYLITGDEIGASGSEEGPSKLAVVPLTFMGERISSQSGSIRQERRLSLLGGIYRERQDHSCCTGMASQ